MPCVPIFDPPWVPVNAGTVPDAISEDQSVRVSGPPQQTYPGHAQILQQIFPHPFIQFFLCSLHTSEVILGACSVSLSPAGGAHPEEHAAGGREEEARSGGQHHHGHPDRSRGLL